MPGHEVEAYEGPGRLLEPREPPEGPWAGRPRRLRGGLPGALLRTYDDDVDLDETLCGADVVIVHEWNEPWLVAAIGGRAGAAGFHAAFPRHPPSRGERPDAIRTFDLDGYDGVLAFGEDARGGLSPLGLARPRLHLARGR